MTTPAFPRSLLLLPVLALTACGYGLVGRTSNLPSDIQRIFVSPLENQTTRSQVELLLTEAITNELVTRRRFTVVRTRSEADAVLSGAVTAFAVRPVTFDADGRAEEYEIAVRADMLFKRSDAAEVIWQRDQYLFRDNYELDLESVEYFDPEDATIQLVARRFAETLVIDLLEGF